MKAVSGRLAVRITVISAVIIAAFAVLSLSRMSITRVEGEALAVDNPAKAKAAFSDAAKVFFSPRCANCHPSGDNPLQGNEGRVHDNGITRGPKGRGTEELACAMCHQETNTDGDGMPPGAPDWRMPPPEAKMVFPGLTVGQLCRNLKDPKLNDGHKTAAESIHHIATDPRVRWAWTPGNKRTPPPMGFEEFVKKMNEWVDNGAACPE